MRFLNLAIAAIDAVTEAMGRLVSWLVLYMVLMTVVNVVLRYMYGLSLIPLLESVVYAFAIVMAVTVGWTLKHNEHVRIDIIYGRRSPRWRAVVDLLGTALFLAPVIWTLWFSALPYVQRSWGLREGSPDVSGLPFVYLLKSVILVFLAGLALQAVAFALSALRVLITGREESPGFAAGGVR